MADTLDILTLTEGKSAVNIEASDTSVDTELAQSITTASRFVDSVFGPVVQRSATKTVAAPSGTIWLEHPAAITSVTEYSAGSPTVLTAEDFDTSGTYRLDATTGALTRRSSWASATWASQEVVVVYTSGRYANTAAVDPKFKTAAAVALVHFWQHFGSQSGYGTPGGDGAPFGGVPFSTAQLRQKLISMFPEEWTGPAVA
jgi:hypothetical protein